MLPFNPVSRRSAGPCRSEGHPDRYDARIIGRGALRSLRAALWRIENSAVGDVLGVIALFAMLVGMLAIGAALEGL